MSKLILIKWVVLLVLISVILAAFLIIPIPHNYDLGTGDFRPYWSASYLFRQGQDFSDPGLMDEIERTLTGWDKSFTMMAWFAPTGMVVLLPFTLLSFEKAALLWLLINILVLCITAILLWEKGNRRIWIPLVAIFAFPMTLLSLYVGQINTLVLFGLAIYLSVEKTGNKYLRGVGLALTTIKPHLVILTFPLIILHSIYHRRWKLLIGFLGAMLFSVIILFVFYPPWINSFSNLISSGMSTLRETPTISGLIVHIIGQGWGKWLWIPALIIFLSMWWYRKEKSNFSKFVVFSVPYSLLFSPIGWGYDQILLLILIIQMLKYHFLENTFRKNVVFWLFLLYLVILVLRFLSPNEIWFIWVSLIFFVFQFKCFVQIKSPKYYDL